MAEKKHTTHKGHVPGFCDWVCFPKRLLEQYTATCGWDIATPEQRQDVEARIVHWAEKVKAEWQGREISESLWAFWNARWQSLEHVYVDTGEPVPERRVVPPRPSREAWQGKLDHPRTEGKAPR